MSRLIDALELKRSISVSAVTEDGKHIFDIIDEQPTIEPERKGKWLDGHRAGYGETLYWYIYCSECLYERDDDDHDKDTPFCPNCGYAMTEEGEQDG